MTAAVLVRGGPRPGPLRAVPMALAVLLVLTAIAYPLTAGSARDAVSLSLIHI